LVCGYLGQYIDFRWGFLAAGIGMLISLITFYYTKDKYVVGPTGEALGTTPNKAKDISVSESGKTGFSSTQLMIIIAAIVAAFCLLFSSGCVLSRRAHHSPFLQMSKPIALFLDGKCLPLISRVLMQDIL
jgi:dipeptide/tripeptide permease